MKFMYPAFVLLPTCCRRPAKRRGKAAGAPGLPSGDRSAGSVGSPLAPAGLFQQAPRSGPHIDTPSTYNNYGFMKKPRGKPKAGKLAFPPGQQPERLNGADAIRLVRMIAADSSNVILVDHAKKENAKVDHCASDRALRADGNNHGRSVHQ